MCIAEAELEVSRGGSKDEGEVPSANKHHFKQHARPLAFTVTLEERGERQNRETEEEEEEEDDKGKKKRKTSVYVIMLDCHCAEKAKEKGGEEKKEVLQGEVG